MKGFFKNMNVTIATLINATPVFSKITNKELSPVVSFRLVKLIKEINVELEIFEKEKEKLLKKYGKKNDDDSYTILDENKDSWNKDITELLSLDVDITAEKVNLANEDIKISPADMMKIEEFVEM